MPSTISTFNALHLGDNLVHLHFLRKLALRHPDIHFTHGAPDEHLAQLYPLWCDVKNLTVKSIAEVGQGAINAWRGAGGWFYQQPDQHDFVAIHLRWFRHLADLMGLESPITQARDLLFDYPSLRIDSPGAPRQDESTVGSAEVDFLIINSRPMSGQWAYDYRAWLRFFDCLPRHARVVTTENVPERDYPCTRAQGMDITAIGRLSQRARCIIGCVTGPMWPCLNIWSAETVQHRIHLLAREFVEILPDRTVHANSLSLVPEILKDRGLI